MDESNGMVENATEAPVKVTERRRDSVTIAAIWAVAFVVLACIAATTLVAVIFLNNAPW
jgi:hypothetical protein